MVQKKKVGSQRQDKFYWRAKMEDYPSRASFKLIELNDRYKFLESSTRVVDLCAAPGGWSLVCAERTPSEARVVGVDLDKFSLKPYQRQGKKNRGIHKVISLVGDITVPATHKAVISALRQDDASVRADVVLNDGAPNCGTQSKHDAYLQNLLVLWAIKFAVNVLRRGGTFVSKYFQSSDSAKLEWVLRQMFRHVAVEKPAASRSVSSEKFFVATDFKFSDVSEIDARYFDENFVFAQYANAADEGPSNIREVLGIKKNGKYQKHGQSYHQDMYDSGLISREGSIADFLRSNRPLQEVASFTRFSFIDPDTLPIEHEDRAILEVAKAHNLDRKILTHAESVKELVSDLSPRGGFMNEHSLSALINWHSKVRGELLSAGIIEAEAGEIESDSESEIDEEVANEDELAARVAEREARAERRRQRKVHERKMKSLRRQAGMQDGGLAKDITEAESRGLFNQSHAAALASSDTFIVGGDREGENGHLYGQSAAEPEAEDSSEEEEDYGMARAAMLEQQYQEYRDRVSNRQEQATLDAQAERQRRKLLGKVGFELAEDDFLDEARDQRRRNLPVVDLTKDVFAKDEEESGSEMAVADAGATDAWFSHNDLATAAEEAEEEDSSAEEAAANLLPMPRDFLDITHMKEKRRVKAEREAKAEAKRRREAGEDIELVEQVLASNGMMAGMANNAVPESNTLTVEASSAAENDIGHHTESLTDEQRKMLEQSMKVVRKLEDGQFADVEESGPTGDVMDDDSDSDMSTDDEDTMATRMALGQKMLRRKDREALLDDAYNRYAWNDPDCVPTWFKEDEAKYNVPQLPVTKAEVDAQRRRLAALDAKPIRKVLEAKGRNKMRAARQARRLNSLAESITSRTDLTEEQQLRELQKIAARASRMKKQQHGAKKFVAGGVGRGPRSKRTVSLDSRSRADTPRGRRGDRLRKAQAKMGKRSGPSGGRRK